MLVLLVLPIAMADKERKSLCHLADKFNHAPPPGYVAGRGRGASGFSKPPADPPKRGGPPPSSAAGSSSAADKEAAEKEANDKGFDLGATEKFEQAGMSMEKDEAGGNIEAFNMDAERKEGNFDDDFNYTWKKKGEDPDDVHDAFLDGMDSGEKETEEKVAKRRELLQKQLDAQNAPAEAPPDVPSLLASAVACLQEGETVARALGRLSGSARKPGGGQPAAKRQKQAAVDQTAEQKKEAAQKDAARKQQFDRLTEAADGLLRAGMLDIYSESYERLCELHAERSATNAAEAGIGAEVHEAAVAGGFVFDVSQKLYYNAGSGLMFDPSSGYYWDANGVYYYWDAASESYVKVESSGAEAEAEPAAAPAAAMDGVYGDAD